MLQYLGMHISTLFTTTIHHKIMLGARLCNTPFQTSFSKFLVKIDTQIFTDCQYSNQHGILNRNYWRWKIKSNFANARINFRKKRDTTIILQGDAYKATEWCSMDGEVWGSNQTVTINLLKRTVHREHSLDTEATNTTNTPVSTQITVKQATEVVSARCPAGTIQWSFWNPVATDAFPETTRYQLQRGKLTSYSQIRHKHVGHADAQFSASVYRKSLPVMITNWNRHLRLQNWLRGNTENEIDHDRWTFTTTQDGRSDG